MRRSELAKRNNYEREKWAAVEEKEEEADKLTCIYDILST